MEEMAARLNENSKNNIKSNNAKSMQTNMTETPESTFADKVREIPEKIKNTWNMMAQRIGEFIINLPEQWCAYDPPAVFDSNKSEILLSTENKLKEIYEVFPNEGKVVLGYSYLVSWNYVTWLDFPRPIDEELIPLFKKWIRKFPENKLELMEYYSFILFEKWLYMDSLDNISEANKIYYEIKAIADELSKDYADNQVTQMLSMGIVRKL